MELKEVFDEVAAAPMPPSRLTADGVYRAGQRRHTVLVAGRMLGVFALTTLLLLGASTLRHVAGDRRAGTGLPPGSTGNDWPGPVLWAGGADRAHLFAIMANCAACALRLIGSDNGGASWTERSLPPDVGRWMPAQAAAVLGASPPIVTGPGVIGLAATKMVDLRPTPTVSLGPAGAATRWWVSVDSARSWRPVTTQSTAASAVPANGWADCVPDPGRDRCTGYLVDPLTATESPLENQPTRDPQTMSMLAGGALWATSDDGPSRPAVSVSHDAGRTWATHEFTDLTANNGQRPTGRQPVPATRDGHTVYVVISDDSTKATQVYRSDDAGSTWRHGDTGHSLPYADVLPSVVLADGTHLVQRVLDDRVEHWVGSDPAGPYKRVTLAGLPSSASFLVCLADASCLAYWRKALYTSADGRSWTGVTFV